MAAISAITRRTKEKAGDRCHEQETGCQSAIGEKQAQDCRADQIDSETKTGTTRHSPSARDSACASNRAAIGTSGTTTASPTWRQITALGHSQDSFTEAPLCQHVL